MAVTIVAIPRQDDYVWKISSEKVPHLTILHLDDISDGAALQRVLLFVQHVAETSLDRFYASVDHRGVLGPLNADVLFLDKHYLKKVIAARESMLRQPDIKVAYDAIQQYPEWTPHLTLGYPTAPAHEDKREYPGIHNLSFDKLAVWTGDYSGPEFELKDREEEALAMSDKITNLLQHAAKAAFSTTPWSNFKESDYDLQQWQSACLIKPSTPTQSKADYKIPVKEPNGTYNKNGIHAAAAALAGARGGVQASDTQIAAAKKKLVGLYSRMGETPPESISGKAKHSDLIDDVLAHHGVKGMKWGVRRAEKQWNKQITNVNTKSKMTLAFHNETVSRINRAVDDLNRSDKYRDVDLNTYHGKLKDDYEKDSHEAIMRALEDSVRSHYGYSPSGTQRAVYNRKTDQIDVIQVPQVHHAATPKELAPDITIQLHRDKKGKIASVSLVPLQQSDIPLEPEEFVLDYLAHYGVKGMKWGVRRDGSTSSTTVRTSRLRRPATDITAKQKPGQFVRTSGGQRQIASEDAVRVAAARQLAKKSTTDALTNKQLQEAVTRMNLEQQYSQLAKKSDRRTRGQRFIQALMGTGRKTDQTSATAQTAKQVAAALAKKAAASAAAGA